MIAIRLWMNSEWVETTKHTHILLNSRTKSQIQILYSREFLQHQSVHQAIGTQLPYKHNTSLIHSRMNIIGMCSVHGLPIYLSTRIFTRYTNVERIMHAICERHTPRRYLSPAMPLARMPQQTVKPMVRPSYFPTMQMFDWNFDAYRTICARWHTDSRLE